MTAPDVVELGRRAVACPGWRWLSGMLVTGADTLTARIVDDGEAIWQDRGGWWSVAAAAGPFTGSVPMLPDLADPGTCGALLALVRHAWGDPTLSAAWAARRWYIVTPVRGVGFDALKAIDAPDELSALVMALEAAPVRS